MTGNGVGVELNAAETTGHALGLLTEQGVAADELGFVELTEDAQTGHDGGDVGRELVAVEGQTDLEAEGVAAAETAGGDVGGHEAVPVVDDGGVAGVDLEAVLTGVAGAGDEDGLDGWSGDIDGLDLIEREVVAGEAEDALDDSFGLGALDGELTEVVAAVGDLYVEAVGLCANPGVVFVDVGGVDGEEETVVGESADAGVVDGAAVGVAHHAVEHLTGGNAAEVVGEEVVDEALGVGAGDDDLTHVGDVEDAAVVTDSVVLVDDGGVLDGHVETGKGLHEGALGDMAGMEAGESPTPSLVHKAGPSPKWGGSGYAVGMRPHPLG